MEELDVTKFIEKTQKAYEFKEFSENDTYALRMLKQAAQQKLFWHFIEELGIPNNRDIKSYVYYYFNGKNASIGSQYVYMCREKLQPAKWYYKIGEKLPPRIEFTPKFGVEYLQFKESVAHQKFVQLQKEYTIANFAKTYGLSVQQVKNICYKRYSPYLEKKVFKILPPASVITKLRDVIHPDYWFIFPEELEG